LDVAGGGRFVLDSSEELMAAENATSAAPGQGRRSGCSRSDRPDCAPLERERDEQPACWPPTSADPPTDPARLPPPAHRLAGGEAASRCGEPWVRMGRGPSPPRAVARLSPDRRGTLRARVQGRELRIRVWRPFQRYGILDGKPSGC
jgi:hypothetical protein